MLYCNHLMQDESRLGRTCTR